MNRVKRFFKELKRVRWPSARESNKAFYVAITFIVIAALILFALAIALAQLWKSAGIQT